MRRSVLGREAGDDEEVGVKRRESARERQRMHLFTLARPSSRQNKDQKLCG